MAMTITIAVLQIKVEQHQIARAGHPSRIAVLLNSEDGESSGLLTDSVVMTDNLATVTLSTVSRVIGSLPMSDISQALKHTLGLNN